MRISDWSSDVCSSDLLPALAGRRLRRPARPPHRFWRQRGARADPRLVAYSAERALRRNRHRHGPGGRDGFDRNPGPRRRHARRLAGPRILAALRSEEHTSELQSLMRISYAGFCLKKKKTTIQKAI